MSPNEVSKYKVPCIPLYTILKGWGHTQLDILGVDVEGTELQVE